MQIAGLSLGYPDTSAIGRRAEPGQAVAGQSEGKPPDEAGSPNGAMALLAKIVSRYDLRNITPRDFSEMLRRLRDSGVLSDSEYRELAQIRIDLDEQNIDADEPIDLLEFCRQTQEKLRCDADWTENRTDAAAHLDAARRRLAWLEKAAVVQEFPQSAGISQLV